MQDFTILRFTPKRSITLSTFGPNGATVPESTTVHDTAEMKAAIACCKSPSKGLSRSLLF